MQDFGGWLDANKAWIFDGIGVAAITGLGYLLWSRFGPKGQPPADVQGASGNIIKGGSNNVQVVGNVHLGSNPLTPGPNPLDHDRALFAKYDAILSERQIREEINGPLFDHRTSRTFVESLSEYVQLGRRTEGEFLSPELQTAFAPALARLAELKAFIGTHFFSRITPGNRLDDERLSLYPELRHRHGNSDAEFYDQTAKELLAALDDVEAAYDEFRRAVKQLLFV